MRKPVWIVLVLGGIAVLWVLNSKAPKLASAGEYVPGPNEVPEQSKRIVADMVVGQGKMISGNFSEPSTTSILGARPLATRARRTADGWRVSGRKMFASMLQAADATLVMTYPDGAHAPAAAALDSAGAGETSSTPAKRSANGSAC